MNHFMKMAACLALALGTMMAHADNWPAKPVRIVVPTNPGNSVDAYARLVASNFSKTFGQPFVVENKSGANGLIGTEFVANSAPDGHTLLFTYAAAHVVSPNFYKTSYDIDGDFKAIAQLSSGGTILVVHPSVSARDIEEFASYARKNTGALFYGSLGTGANGFIAMELIKKAKGISIEHVPYKSMVAILNDLAAGNIQAAFADTFSSRPFIQAGRMKPIAITGSKRFSELPNVRTLTEQGVKFNQDGWLGMFAPSGVDDAIVEKINKDLARQFSDPKILADIRKITPWTNFKFLDPSEFSKLVHRDSAAWKEMVLQVGATGDGK